MADVVEQSVGDVPQVSVCVPVYNGSAFIAETLHSILAQTYCNFELLVTDNQ
jgi:glycosyltransferase involved in cell wall biosynthesis